MDDLITYGKIQPQATDIEVAVLGAVITEKEALDEVIGMLTEGSFYKNAHQYIWRAVNDLHIERKNVDLLTVSAQLKKNGHLEEAGGYFGVAQISNSNGSIATVKDHAKIILEKYLSRQLIVLGTELARDSFDETTDPFQLLNDIQDKIFKLQSGYQNLTEIDFIDMLADVSKELKEAAEKGYISGIPTGSATLDRHTGGYQKGDLILGGARPSMGKTTFTISKALAQAKANIPVGYVSLEVTGKALIKKMLSNELSIDGKTINRGGLTREQWVKFDATTQSMTALPFHIYDSKSRNIQRICSWIRKVVLKHGVKMVYLDYLQLCEAANKKRGEDANRDMSEVSGVLKGLAMELDIPIFALSQLSREVEKRSDKHPMLSDLRDSGTLEQNADVVMFFYRAEYYGIKEFGSGGSTEGIAEVSIAKFRNGETADFLQRFNGALSRFEDYNYESNYTESTGTTPF